MEGCPVRGWQAECRTFRKAQQPFEGGERAEDHAHGSYRTNGSPPQTKKTKKTLQTQEPKKKYHNLLKNTKKKNRQNKAE